MARRKAKKPILPHQRVATPQTRPTLMQPPADIVMPKLKPRRWPVGAPTVKR